MPRKNRGTPQLWSAHLRTQALHKDRGLEVVDMTDNDALTLRMYATRLRIQTGNSCKEQLLECVAGTLATISQTEERIVRTDALIAHLLEALVGAVS
jgi:hypothetical protein